MKTIKVTGCVTETRRGYLKSECPFAHATSSGQFKCQWGTVLAFCILHTTAPDDCPLRRDIIQIELSESEGEK